ncbi:MAG: hypothetical protein ACRDKZ_05625 [Actinomycetota bacterium]
MSFIRSLRIVLATVLLLGATACTGTGINAGEEGGKAFIAFTGMLVVTVIVLAIVLGKEE